MRSVAWAGAANRLSARAYEADMAGHANEHIAFETSSGNVFADLALSDAAELDMKVRLAVKVNGLITAHRLNEPTAAARLDLSQQEISALGDYRLEGFSVERLKQLLAAIGEAR
jgi:predicted XRE-type DNA-binding protein